VILGLLLCSLVKYEPIATTFRRELRPITHNDCVKFHCDRDIRSRVWIRNGNVCAPWHLCIFVMLGPRSCSGSIHGQPMSLHFGPVPLVFWSTSLNFCPLLRSRRDSLSKHVQFVVPLTGLSRFDGHTTTSSEICHVWTPSVG
jgi:hypothetical protein